MKEQGWRASWAPPRYRQIGQLGRQAGRPATVHPATLFRFGNFMKKKGEAGRLWQGQLKDIALPTRGGGEAGATEDAGWWSWMEGERVGMMEREETRAGWALVAAQLVREGHAVLVLLPPSSQFHFHGLLKISQSAISFSLSSPPRHLPATGRQVIHPRQQENTYLSITFFFCRQKSSVSDTMKDRINCLCVGKRLQKNLHRRMKKSGYKNVYIGESFFAYVGNDRGQIIIVYFFSLSSISFLYRSKNFFKL